MAPLLQLVSLNKRSAMLLDRLMYNLKEIMKKPPVKDGGGDKESSVNPKVHIFWEGHKNMTKSPSFFKAMY